MWKIGAHVVGALVVIGLASSSAFAIDKSSALVNVQFAKRIVWLNQLSFSGGFGGKVPVVPDGAIVYDVDEGHTFSGDIAIPVGNVTVMRTLDMPCYAGRGTKTTQTRATCKHNTKKDDPSDAASALSWFAGFFADLNDAHLASVDKKKSKAYRPIDESFTFESGKIASKARVFDGFSKYSGTFKASFKGRTSSGRRVKAKLKLVYKSAQRNF